MEYLCLAFCLMFCYFAYLNFNDPDWYLWVTIYFAAAAASLLAYFHLASLYADAAFILFCIIYSIWNWPEKWEGIRMPMSHSVNIEKARESLGLLICAACTLFSYHVAKGGWIF